MKLATAILALVPMHAAALDLEFPGLATPLAEQRAPVDSVFLPDAPYSDGPISGVAAEGAITVQSWKVGSGNITTLQILSPLRDQLDAAGYEVVFECEAEFCGGFDFRFKLDVLAEPDMHVNLGDYRYLLAQKPGDGVPDYASLIVSRSANSGFVQLTRVGVSSDVKVTTSTKAPPARTVAAGPVGDLLELNGHATLDDLVFKTGSSALGDADFDSLKNLAEYLSSRPDRTVVLVGHTDSEGGLGANMALSKRRATSVMEQLIARHGVDAKQVSADGVGFLSPIASNLTPDGRAQNRRVEVILTSTQ